MEIEDIESQVDSITNRQKKGKRHFGKMTKTLMIFGVMLVSATLVSATLLTYFVKFDANITVVQAVTVTGGPLSYTGTLNAGCCVCTGPFTATNNGCKNICLGFTTSENHTGTPGPLPEGLTVSIKQCAPGGGSPTPIPCELAGVKLRVLDGQATGDDDDYSVYVDGQFAGSYDATEGGDETWVTSFFDISALHMVASGKHTVKIVCDATTPWSGYATYGQLAVDWIELYRDCPTCVNPVLCEGVDIGIVADESDNNLLGWSTFIVTHDTGGNYGGIGEYGARCTWFGTEDSTQSWASVDLTCPAEYCGEIPGQSGECDCKNQNVVVPVCLAPGQSICFCICYETDILMPSGGPYKLETTIIPMPSP